MAGPTKPHPRERYVSETDDPHAEGGSASPAPQGAASVVHWLREARPRAPIEERRFASELRARMFGEIAEPVTLSRYVVLDRLGSGASGVVYRGYDPKLDRKVAIKLLQVHARTAVEEHERRLLNEAQALARLNHPAVIAVYDVGTYDSTPAHEAPEGGVFVVMELVEGPTLTAWLAARTRTWREILAVLVAAGRGLEAAHRAGIVHRDFKPEHVLIGSDGRVRVVDFGLASATEAGVAADPRGGDPIVGTPAYMAPEQHRGEPCTPSADQYAFFVTAFEALYGVAPFAGSSVAELEIDKRERRLRAPPAGARVPKWLGEAVVHGLAPVPAGRFGSMGEALAHLERKARLWYRRPVPMVASTVAVGALAFALARAQEPDACEGSQAAVLEIWNPEVRRELERRFQATELPSAAGSAIATARALDRYSESWAQVRGDVCATQVETRVEQETRLQQLSCLQHRLTRWRDLTAMLQAADAKLVAYAVDAVLELPRPENCLVPRDSSEQVGGEGMTGLDREILRAESLYFAGDYADGVRVAEQALAAARTQQATVAAVRAGLVLANLRLETGDWQGVEDELGAVIRTAEAAGDEDQSIRGLVELVHVIGHVQARFREADRLAMLAQARLDRRGLRDELDLRFGLVRGMLDRAQGRYLEAEDGLGRTLELATAMFGRDHPRSAELINELGNVRDLRGRYDEALGLYREVLEIRRETLGPEHPRVASSRNNIANVLFSLGRVDESLQEYGKALAIFRTVYGDRHVLTAMIHNNTGIVFHGQRRHREALNEHRRALEIRLATMGTEHPLVADSHDNLGSELFALADLDGALVQHQVAFEMRERRLEQDHPKLGTSLNNLGVVLAAIGRGQDALDHHLRALALRERTLGGEHPDVAQSLYNVGCTLDQLGRPRDAIARLERALAIVAARFGPEHTRLVEILLELGWARFAVGDHGAAAEHLRRGLAIHEASSGEPVRRAELSATLALAESVGPDRSGAIERATEAAEIFRGVGDPRGERLTRWSRALARHRGPPSAVDAAIVRPLLPTRRALGARP